MVTRWDVERAVTNSNIDSRGRLIVLALLTKADNDTARTTAEHTPAFSTLCAMTGLSKAVVSEWLQALEDGNWVIRTNPSAGGKGNRTLYELRPGADKIERRSRDLRKPRKPANSSPSEPFEGAETVRPADGIDAQTVRPADALDAKQFAQRTPNSSPSERFEPSNSSPSERATTLRTTKNHPGAQRAEAEPNHEAPSDSSSVRSWEHANQQPRTDGERVPRQPSLFDVRRAEIDKSPEAMKLIGHWLQANGFPHVSLDDCRAVHQAIRQRHAGVKDMLGYIRGIASGSGFYAFYQPIIEARADQIQKQIRQLTAGQPDCGHGYPGGNLPHPTTRLALCPQCKAGRAPQVQRGSETTHPDVRATLDAYRAAYRVSYGVGPLLPLLMRTTAEAETLRRNRINTADLVTLATTAGRAGSSLLEAAQHLKGRVAA